MSPSLIVSDRVNFIDDNGMHIAQVLPALNGGQQDVERFRRCHQDVRRRPQHLDTLFGKRVARAYRGSDLRQQNPALPRELHDFAERHLQVFLNVVAQRLQRRDIDDFGAVTEFTIQCLANQKINAGEKSCQRLARAGWRRDQSRAPREDVRPPRHLRLGGCAELANEPLLHQRVRPLQCLWNPHDRIIVRVSLNVRHSFTSLAG